MNLKKKTLNLSYIDLGRIFRDSGESPSLAGFRRPGRRKADFKGAQLSEWDFSGQYLNAVNFRDADLSKAAFREANLEDTDFRGADLREADFTTARNLLPSQLAGADLSGSCLPADLEKFASLPHVDAATRHAQTLFFTQLPVCVKYCTT